MKKYTRRLQTLWQDNRHPLANLYRHWHYQQQLMPQVHKVIARVVMQQTQHVLHHDMLLPCVVGQYQNERLAIYVPNHSQGQFLRDQHRAIVQQLKKMTAFADLQTFRVVVDPGMFAASSAQQPDSGMADACSSKTCRHGTRLMQALARQVQHPGLAERLRQLAATLASS